MEGNEHELMLACVISGTLFSVLGSASFALLWAVNWRPWRIYRFLRQYYYPITRSVLFIILFKMFNDQMTMEEHCSVCGNESLKDQ